MKYAHSIKLTVFSYEHENRGLILDALLRLFPFNPEDGKVALKSTYATGFNDKKIEIFEVTLAKENLINQFLKNRLSSMDISQRHQLLGQAESRLDKNLDFFIRFDKDSWIKDGKLILTDSGKCFHLKISIASFPKKMEVALNVIGHLFSENESSLNGK